MDDNYFLKSKNNSNGLFRLPFMGMDAHRLVAPIMFYTKVALLMQRFGFGSDFNNLRENIS